MNGGLRVVSEAPFGDRSALLSLHLLRIVLIVLILTHLLVLFRNSDCTAFYDFAYYRNERSGAEEGIPRTSLTVAVIEYAISGEGAERERDREREREVSLAEPSP